MPGPYSNRLPALLGQCSRGAVDIDEEDCCNSCEKGNSPFGQNCRQVRFRVTGPTNRRLLWGGACAGCVFQRTKKQCSLYRADRDVDDQIDTILGAMNVAQLRSALSAPVDDDGNYLPAFQGADIVMGTHTVLAVDRDLANSDNDSSDTEDDEESDDPKETGELTGEWSEEWSEEE